MPFDHLAEGRFQHTDESSLYIICQLVDDIVVTDIDAFFLCLAQGSPVSFDVEADNDGSRGRGQVYIGFTDIADSFMDQAHLEVLFAKLGECIFDGLGRTLHVALEHQVQFFDRTLLHLHIEAVQADLAKRHSLGTALLGSLLCKLLGCTLITRHLETISGLWHFRQAKYTYRQAWRSFLDALTPVVEHGPYLAGQGANDDIVAHFERA